MTYDSGSSASLLTGAAMFCVIHFSDRGTRVTSVAAERGRFIARRSGRARWWLVVACTIGVAVLAMATVWNFMIGYWWPAILVALCAISSGWALVENVRRRDDPADSDRPWPRAYRYVGPIFLVSWVLLLSTWVAADLLDGRWEDAILGLIGWCVIVSVTVWDMVLSKRGARARAAAPPLRRVAGQGELSLRRPSNRWAVGLVLAVHADYRLVAELRAGESTALIVDAGEHDLVFVAGDWQVGSQRCEVPADGRLDIELSLNENFMAAGGVPDEALGVRLMHS